jgi:outer membrane protein assembly factor BamD (BamD/ComL family)
LDEALAQFTKVRDTYAGSTEARDSHLALAQILMVPSPAKAAAEYKAFLDRYTDYKERPAVWSQYGDALREAGKRAEAAEEFNKLIAAHPQHRAAQAAHFKLIKLYEDDQKPSEVEKVLTSFIQKYPDHPYNFFCYSKRARILFSQAKNENKPELNDQAIAILKEYTAKYPRLSIDLPPDDPSIVASDRAKFEAVAKRKLGAPRAWNEIARHHIETAQKLGRYLVLDDKTKKVWEANVEAARPAVEKVMFEYADSDQVLEAQRNLLTIARLYVESGKLDEKGVRADFEKLAGKLDGEGAKAITMFSLASFLWEREGPGRDERRKAAVRIMEQNYRPNIAFTPRYLDMYAEALFDAKRNDEVLSVVKKLREDNGPDAEVELPDAKDAEPVALFWEAKVKKETGAAKEAEEKLAELRTKYPGSSKKNEAELLVLEAKVQQGQFEEGWVNDLIKIVTAQNRNPSIPARAMFLSGRIMEELGRKEWAETKQTSAGKYIDSAIDYYAKISGRFPSARELSAEGLWRAASMLEEQVKGSLPVYIPPAKAPVKPAAEAAAPGGDGKTGEEGGKKT